MRLSCRAKSKECKAVSIMCTGKEREKCCQRHHVMGDDSITFFHALNGLFGKMMHGLACVPGCLGCLAPETFQSCIRVLFNFVTLEHTGCGWKLVVIGISNISVMRMIHDADIGCKENAGVVHGNMRPHNNDMDAKGRTRF